MECKNVEYNSKNYCVIKINNVLAVIDHEDIVKLPTAKLSVVSNYIRYNMCKNDKRTTQLLHNTIMDFTPTTTMKIDHINRITTDNRKENLRIATSTEQNQNRKKRERKVELPKNCGIEPDDIPRNITYVKETVDKDGRIHGEHFAIDIKGLSSGRIRAKSSKDKNLSLKEKLEQVKIKLNEIYDEHQELKMISSIDGVTLRNNLRNSFNEIIKLSGFNEDIINNNLVEMEEYHKQEIDKTIISKAKMLVENSGNGKNHNSKLPNNCGVNLNDIPKYVHYENRDGGIFIIENHPKLKELGKKRLFSRKSNKLSTKEKFDDIMEKLQELEIN